MMKNEKETVWAEAYRPNKIADVVLPKAVKLLFQAYVKEGRISNHLLLSGRSGMGKTTSAIALCEEIGADYIVIPASIESGIETLREKMVPFASTVSFTDNQKVIILDESDHLNQKSVMPALRNFMDEFGHNCILIMTCNEKSRMIPAVVSRSTAVDFVIPKDERNDLAKEFFLRFCEVLKNEQVTFEPPALMEIMKKKFPDMRSALVMAQSIADSNDNNIKLIDVRGYNTSLLKDLFGFVSKKAYTDARKWIAENTDIDTDTFYRAFYEALPTICADVNSEAYCTTIVADFAYKEGSVADVEINRVAMVATLMSEGRFK